MAMIGVSVAKIEAFGIKIEVSGARIWASGTMLGAFASTFWGIGAKIRGSGPGAKIWRSLSRNGGFGVKIGSSG